METIRHDGRETAYRLTGRDRDGAAALYVHGSGGNHRVWVHQYAPGGPTHPAAAVDLSGHGQSDDVDTDPGPETLAAYAADVAAVADEVDADVLVGNSLGGAVLFEVLLEGRFEPTGVIFAGTGARLAVDEQLRELLAGEFEAAVERLHGPDMFFSDLDEETVERSKAAMRDAGREVTRRDFLTCHAFDVRDRLAGVGLPSLAVVGENDRLTPPQSHEYLADHLPNCERAVVEGAAHLAMLERPTVFNAAVERFVAEL